MIHTTDKKWFALYVASRQEKNVVRLLTEKGIEAYVPLVKTMRQWSDRKKLVEFPLINGYTFVKASPLEFEKSLQTKGVVNVVRYMGKPAVVREIEIDNLKQLVSLGYHINAYQSESIKKGDKIKITSGALKGLEGLIIEEAGESYFEVCLDSIGYNLRVTLPTDILALSK